MTKDEALNMCLEYIETDAHERKYVRHAIKEALAQPEQEPVGWAEHGVINWLADKQFNHTSFLYATPPQRKPHPDEFKCPYCYDQSQRNEVLEEVAKEFDKMAPFGDTAQSFATYVRMMKR